MYFALLAILILFSVSTICMRAIFEVANKGNPADEFEIIEEVQ